jgi:hypothetical protein
MKEKEMSNEQMQIAEGIFKTFVNRYDSFALQQESGQYFSSKNEITVHHVISHLKGEITIAVYLLSENGAAKISVIDADDEEGFEKLRRVHEELEISSYLESSRRGGHLWFFFEHGVEGKVAKNFGLEIAKKYKIEAEVFPKQAHSEGPGSCIRLPFGVHRKTGERYPFIGLGTWREQLDALTHPRKVAIADVMKCQYQEPERKALRPVLPDADYKDLPIWEKIKRQITVREMVEQYVDLNAKGMGKCPFHDDVNPSLSVNDKENYWNCFAGCSGGSVIDFWMKLNRMDFSEASKDLAERLGIK